MSSEAARAGGAEHLLGCCDKPQVDRPMPYAVKSSGVIVTS